VSSSAIRSAIESGDLHAAEKMLGRPVSILGTVVPGDRRGSRLGFPTANLDLHHEVRPPPGVYICTARAGRTWRRAVTSIGRQRTFGSGRDHAVEVFVPGVCRDLYGRDLEVRFARRLRPQVRFDSPDALAEQIRDDVRALKRARLPKALTTG
jgi:riboflavin kinase/FMN adenylyltransferase